MISIYELRLRSLWGGSRLSTGPTLHDLHLFDSGRSALFFFLSHMRKYDGRTTVYVNMYTTDVVHKTIRRAGCRLVPVDIDPYTFKPIGVENAVFRNTVFIQTGLFGFGCFDEKIFRKVKADGGVFLEDCCNSFGTVIDGRTAGTVGDAAIYSFRVGKALSTGGGALRINECPFRAELASLYKATKHFDIIEEKKRLFRTYFDYLLFQPTVLHYISRPARHLQKQFPFLQRLARGGVVDTLTEVDEMSLRKMSRGELRFAHRRLAQWEEEQRIKRSVSECLHHLLAPYPVFSYAGCDETSHGWNFLFFPILLLEGDPESFIVWLRRAGFDATRFHSHVPGLSFPDLPREDFPGTYTIVDRLVCIPNTTRMAGKESRLARVIDSYFAHRRRVGT